MYFPVDFQQLITFLYSSAWQFPTVPRSVWAKMKASEVNLTVFSSQPFGQATSRPKHPPTSLALQHFDATYGVQLGQLWPSVRVALLSERKYGALLNNFSHDAILENLQAQGCSDFISDTDTEGRCARQCLQPTSVNGWSVYGFR